MKKTKMGSPSNPSTKLEGSRKSGVSTPSPYEPVPVDAARDIAEKYGKSIVIIFAHDPVHGLMHTTTYGTDPQNKAWAAQGGEIGTKALGGLREASIDFEDYRLKCARELLAALKGVVEQIKLGNLVRVKPKTANSPEFNARQFPLAAALKAADEVIETAEEFL